jgi:signal transduction histidine kinase
MRAFLRAYPMLTDAAVGLIVAAAWFAIVVLGPGPQPQPRPLNAGDIAVAVLAVALLSVRRRWPVPVLVVATGVALAMLIGGEASPVPQVVTFIAAFTVAASTDRRTAGLAGLGVGVILYVGSGLYSGDGWLEPQTLAVLAWTGMAIAIGDGLRTRRAYIAAIEERARRAEQSRDEEARRRVVEERLRIARELHDVVAHHIAMINVQAGVAAHLLRRRPDQAEEARSHVRSEARSVLDEISTLLSVLRRSDDPEADEPTRGLARLCGLLDSLAAAGLRVEHRQDGESRDLPAAVDLAAYRIVQESLTNAQKHGAGNGAHLRVAYTSAGVHISVWNKTAATEASGSGHGLIGMRERAAAVGGTLDTEHGGGRFHLEAHLPITRTAP